MLRRLWRWLRCSCPADATGPWDCTECPVHGEEASAECQAQAQSEADAENAWLRHAEMGTPETQAEEDYERAHEAFWGYDSSGVSHDDE